jgi:DNA-binding NtrC family response regulator
VPEVSEGSGGNAPASRLRVLLADDERAIAVTLGDAIERAGHEVTVVRDGTAAVRALDAGDYDAVISDVRMPGLGGMAVLRHAKARNSQIEVILITGFGTEQASREAIGAGAL